MSEPATFEAVHKKIESAEMISLPALPVPLADANAIFAVNKLIEALEEHDDVKEVFSNAEFSGETVAA